MQRALIARGVDKDAIEGDITWVPNTDDPIFWKIPFDGIAHEASNTTHKLTNAKADVDSGTSVTWAPKEALDPTVLKIPGSKDLGKGRYGIPCDTKDSISFILGGKLFKMDPSKFTGKAVGGGLCEAKVYYNLSKDYVMLGDFFFHSVYSVYRYDPPAVGFAPYKKK